MTDFGENPLAAFMEGRTTIIVYIAANSSYVNDDASEVVRNKQIGAGAVVEPGQKQVRAITSDNSTARIFDLFFINFASLK
jgi:hypothetical protein